MNDSCRLDGGIRVLRLLALLLSVSLLAACGSSTSVRHKMIVEVETPDGLRTGSAVRETTYQRPPNLPAIGEDRGQVILRGEAVAVDLPNGQTLFVLLSSVHGSGEFAKRIPDRFMGYARHKKPTSEPVTIWPPASPEGVPMLVRFRDTADPTSVEAVKPEALEASFGPGIRLKRIVVQLSKEPITTGIGERLKWLGPYPEPSLNPQHGMDDWSPAATIHHGDFWRKTMK